MTDLANTLTQMACGFRMYGDVARLSDLSGAEVVIGLLARTCTCDGDALVPPLGLARESQEWFSEHLARDGVPAGTVQAATLTLRPVVDERGWLYVDCSTTLTTTLGTVASRGTARWHPWDIKDIRDV